MSHFPIRIGKTLAVLSSCAVMLSFPCRTVAQSGGESVQSGGGVAEVRRGSLQRFAEPELVSSAALEPGALPSERFAAVYVDARAEVTLPVIDTSKILREDAAKGPDVALRPRVGVRVPAELTSANSGRWIDLGGQGHAWIASIRTAGASSVRLHFSRVSLAAGAILSVRAADDAETIERFTGQGPYGNGDFWSRTLNGDTAIVELYDPGASAAMPAFLIDSAIHFYRDPWTLEPASVFQSALNAADAPATAAVGACQLDATCYPDWSGQADAVARITLIEGEFAYVCSGTLLSNNTADLSPLFLTAHHCVPSEAVARTVEANFFYHTLSCNGKPPIEEFTAAHARYLAGSAPPAGTDYALLELLGTLPRKGGFYPAWAGWSTEVPPVSTSYTGIHHPGGSFRRISFGASQFSTTFSPRFPNYFVVGWYYGMVEPGSSGSALFDQSGRVLGQLSAGNASCTLITGIDIYGQLSESYPTMRGPDGRNLLEAGLGDDSLEPNDTRAAARELGATALTGLVVKNYGAGQGEDWYRLTASPNQLVEAEAIFRHSWGDISLELYRGTEATAVAVSRTAADRERISFRNGAAGETYYLRVFLTGDTRNSYDLALAGARVPCEDSFEPNDTAAAAVALADGRGYEGRLCSETDVDWFRISVPSIAQLSVNLMVPAGRDYDLALYDPAGNLVGTSEKLRGELELIRLQVASPTSFLVKVYGFPATRGDFDTSNPYTVSYSLCEDLFEPNPNFDGAFGSLSAGTDYTGRICNSADADWYKIEVPSAGTLTLNLAVPATRDFDISLYGPARSLIRSSLLGVGRDETITTSVMADTYYVRVYGFLGAFDALAPYALSATYTSQQVPLRIENIPDGLQVNVNGARRESPQTVNWTEGSRHVIGVYSPQPGPDGQTYEFASWSDSGGAFHPVTAGSGEPLTATMTAK